MGWVVGTGTVRCDSMASNNISLLAAVAEYKELGQAATCM